MRASKRFGSQSDMGLSDETLLQKLAGDDLDLKKKLKRIIGSETFSKPEPASPASPVPTGAPTRTTKH